jgi:hypothetical protein
MWHSGSAMCCHYSDVFCILSEHRKQVILNTNRVTFYIVSVVNQTSVD